MEFGDFSLIRLSQTHKIKPFDCKDADLNDFLLADAKPHMQKLLAVTYVLESVNQTAAFFSILNDKISYADTDSNRNWKKYIRDRMPDGKRYTSYPAIKIGRLGVDSAFQGQKLGSAIIDYIKRLFIDNNRTGCKFITVDAYKASLKFYENNGFQYLTRNDENENTRLMYFDLAIIQNTLDAIGKSGEQTSENSTFE